jgi:hypothetical protein
MAYAPGAIWHTAATHLPSGESSIFPAAWSHSAANGASVSRAACVSAAGVGVREDVGVKVIVGRGVRLGPGVTVNTTTSGGAAVRVCGAGLNASSVGLSVGGRLSVPAPHPVNAITNRHNPCNPCFMPLLYSKSLPYPPGTNFLLPPS